MKIINLLPEENVYRVFLAKFAANSMFLQDTVLRVRVQASFEKHLAAVTMILAIEISFFFWLMELVLTKRA